MNGDLVVAWQGASFAILTKDGAIRKEAEFIRAAFDPSVAALADGGFIITYYLSTSSGVGRFQRYDSAGNEVGPEQLFRGLASLDLTPDVTGLADGGWLLSWYDPLGGYFQRFNALGVSPDGLEQIVASTAGENEPVIAALKDGGWVVAWYSNPNAAFREIRLQVYNDLSQPVGPEVGVDSNIGAVQLRPNIAVLENGDFVVTWYGVGATGDDRVAARIFSPTGQPRDDEFFVSQLSTVEDYFRPDVAALDDGGFVITYVSNDGLKVFAREYDADGTPRGDQFAVSGLESSISSTPTAVALEGGGYGVIFDVPSFGPTVVFFGRGTDQSDFEFLSEPTIYRALGGNDFVQGSDGDDEIFGGSGGDILNGEGGDDFIDTGASGATRSVADFASGGAGDDTILGRGGIDVLKGDSGADILKGRGGDDELDGGADDDVLNGGAGDDLLIGGDGDDVLRGGDGEDEARGGAGRDRLFGGNGDDLLTGDIGGDRLRGGDGDDVLRGGSGTDNIRGGDGDDVLEGDIGNDRLRGDAGADILTGGAGRDTYVFNTPDFGDDVVRDFGVGGAETFDMRGSGATAFGDLTITNDAQNALIELGDASILVIGASGQLDASDFQF